MLFTCTDDMFLSRNGRHRKGKRRKSAGPISEPPTPTVTLELIILSHHVFRKEDHDGVLRKIFDLPPTPPPRAVAI